MDYDVIIVGGGPAGLTAAIYTSRARLETLLLESLSVPGQAVITDCIENYPGFPDGINGLELIEKFRRQAKRFNAAFATENVRALREYTENGSDGWRIETEIRSYTSLSLIIATGARPRKLGISGEDKFQGRGVSYCATCDGALYKDKDVVVVGGGDTAVEEALFLTRFARKVTLIHRRDRLRAAKILQERAFSNIKMGFVWSAKVIEILGDDTVKKVKLENVKSGAESYLNCDGVFIFVGYLPNTDFIRGLVRLDERGYIVTDDNMMTSKSGIFACGDCRRKLLRQVVTACGDGAVAAFAAQQYIEELKGIAYK